MSEPVVTSGVNGTVKRIGYAYNITGAEFGLQHAPDLRLKVEGSCVTEYSWLVATSHPDDRVQVDYYSIFGADQRAVQSRNLSLYDGRGPRAYFHPGSKSESKTNTTFAIAVSSMGRYSFTEGHDPLYATNASGKTAQRPEYLIKPGRPIVRTAPNNWSYPGRCCLVLGDIRVGTVHRYKILETKVCIVSTLTSLGTLDDTFYKTVSILH